MWELGGGYAMADMGGRKHRKRRISLLPLPSVGHLCLYEVPMSMAFFLKKAMVAEVTGGRKCLVRK